MFDLNSLIGLLPVIFFLIWLFSASVKIIAEYERAVVFRLGRLIGAKGPGLVFVIPIVDQVVKTDLRTITLDVPAQEIITKDNVTVRVNAVCYFRVLDPQKSVVSVANFALATSQIAQTSMRSVVGQVTLDDLLSDREELNSRLQKIIDAQTDPWGVKVSVVELKDVQIPDNMQKAMARQAEAERERRAKVIAAEGEFQAAQKLADAAAILASSPGAMQLRYMQTAIAMTDNKNSTVVFPLPVDIMSMLGGPKK